MNLLKLLRSLSATAFVSGPASAERLPSRSWDLDLDLPAWERHPMSRSRRANAELDANWVRRNFNL
jgi:hypothetical protein